ncbi:MAG: hypothetical protein ACC656_06745, partial [Candidatus Heimdallarchaeota archaeon]
NNTRARSTKKNLVQELINYWLEKVDLSVIKTLEDLDKTVPFPHLLPYSMDALKELSDRKLVTLTPGGKLKWNLRSVP